MTASIAADPYARWLQVLAGLLNPAFPGDLQEPLELLAPHLREEFSAVYLTAESARKVAAAPRHGPVPAWDVVAKALREYAREVRPITAGRLPAPTEPDYPRPDAGEIQRVGDMLGDWLASKTEQPRPCRRARGGVSA